MPSLAKLRRRRRHIRASLLVVEWWKGGKVWYVVCVGGMCVYVCVGGGEGGVLVWPVPKSVGDVGIGMCGCVLCVLLCCGEVGQSALFYIRLA